MGPFWDGNEIWLITAGGVTFAAFPRACAVMFSGLYTPLMLLLFALILRGVAFEFRRQIDSDRWRRVWDACLVTGSFVPALLLGVAFANIFAGIPIDGDGIFRGNLFTLLNPYGLAGGVLFVLLFAMHGTLWLAVKSTGALQSSAAKAARRLHAPLVAATILAVTLFGVGGLFPNLLPSSIDPAHSVTAFNSASSPLTLKIMLTVVLIFLPVVIAYQAWVYVTFREKVTARTLASEPSY